MKITLHPRTEESVTLYYEKAQQAFVRKMLPQKAKSVREALADYEKTKMPGATSYGRTIVAEGLYVGDVWCHSIILDDTPNAMLSYCVFEPDLLGKGIATEAVRLFLGELQERYGLKTIGAFTYADNIPSIRVLEKNEFELLEQFAEDGIVSRYYQRTI